MLRQSWECVVYTCVSVILDIKIIGIGVLSLNKIQRNDLNLYWLVFCFFGAFLCCFREQIILE